jgi:ParB family transcriptional regulator, chromosome partitioning protein
LLWTYFGIPLCLRLLELPADILSAVCNSSIKPSIAEELLTVKDKKKQTELGNLAKVNSLSYRDIRQLIKEIKRNEVYDYSEINETFLQASIKDIDEKAQRSFDKSIIALRIAMTKLSMIIGEIEDNWITYEMLMQHKNLLHQQIDLLIKQKMKL